MTVSRRVLFLQGPTSAFWRELAVALEHKGHSTFKIHVALGDQLWWFRRGGICYRGRFSRWRTFLKDFLTRNKITEVLYYADRQPYHVVAQEVCAQLGVNAIAIENGYLRPDWITFERDGMGVFSHFPSSPIEIQALAKNCRTPDLETRYRHGFAWEIFNEIMYHGFNYLYRPLFPFFKSGRYYDLFAENFSGLYDLLGKTKRQAQAEALVGHLVSSEKLFFVVALQLQADKQIKDNSPFHHLAEMIDLVTASFAAYAESEAILVFKQHPHDNGRENWPDRVSAGAARHGVGDRVFCIDGGDLYGMLRAAKGCITVNSTVGLHALRVNCPMKVLGIAIYDIPGLTHQDSLDTFWQTPAAVDTELCNDFIKFLAATIQIKGSFYDKAGRDTAIKTIIEKLEDELSTLPNSAHAPRPRMAKAHEIGVFDKL
ncbi:capsular biosynthesis protein [Rhizobium sp.]|uniref:capsule biosynthesis protein n=1 Tax=Rhizobium sp. TaxID=391 RepID=UPI002AA8347E